ncbi:MAG TPA: glutaredoxin 3 [Methylocystis sp.]|nr:glutaredoxin 3 [Methylocystis sp.]
MAKIVIYTTATCPYCLAAKRLLISKQAPFEEIKVDGDRSMRARMSDFAGGRTSVPQIFIDGRHVGGCDDLYELERQGRLDALLQTTGATP